MENSPIHQEGLDNFSKIIIMPAMYLESTQCLQVSEIGKLLYLYKRSITLLTLVVIDKYGHVVWRTVT